MDMNWKLGMCGGLLGLQGFHESAAFFGVFGNRTVVCWALNFKPTAFAGNVLLAGRVRVLQPEALNPRP